MLCKTLLWRFRSRNGINLHRDLRINRRLLINSCRPARVSCSVVHPVQRRSIALISCLEQERCLMPQRNNAPTYRLRGHRPICGYLCAGMSEREHICLCVRMYRSAENCVYPNVSHILVHISLVYNR